MSFSSPEKKALAKLGARIKSLRIAKGITQKEMGFRIGKDYQAISRIELGRANPSYLILLQLCEGLEIEIEELFKEGWHGK